MGGLLVKVSLLLTRILSYKNVMIIAAVVLTFDTIGSCNRDREIPKTKANMLKTAEKRGENLDD